MSKKPTVLIVDDEIDLREIFEMYLSGGNFLFTSASSAEEALEKMECAHFDLVLTDNCMPNGMSGRELSKKIKELYPDTYVILSSGGDVEIDPSFSILPKPFDGADLLALIESKLKRGRK